VETRADDLVANANVSIILEGVENLGFCDEPYACLKMSMHSLYVTSGKRLRLMIFVVLNNY